MLKKTILIILLLTVFIILLITGYFIFIDIESKVPKKLEINYNIKTEEYMNRKLFIITPKKENKNNLKILYIHGGAYVAETSDKHWEFIGKIVNDTGATVILPDYPLTPKYNYEDVFNMIEPLYKDIIEKVNPQDLIVMGDSAGGGISLALEEKLVKEKEALPKKLILISPWIDVTLTNKDIDNIEKYDKELNRETLKLAGIAYAGNSDLTNYLISPIYGNLKGLKNVIIYTGTYDILNPDIHKLIEKAKEVDTNITLKEYEKAGHIWFINNNSDVNLMKEAYNDLINTLKTSLEGEI